jgi:hypothetical protein
MRLDVYVSQALGIKKTKAQALVLGHQVSVSGEVPLFSPFLFLPIICFLPISTLDLNTSSH